MMFKLCLLGLLSVAFAAVDEKGNLDDIIKGVFGGNDPNGARNNVPNEKPCNGGAGECVPYYLCVNGTINTDGSDLLDIRFGEGEECVDYFEQCCDTGDVLTAPVIPINNNPPPLNPNVPQPGPGGQPGGGQSKYIFCCLYTTN